MGQTRTIGSVLDQSRGLGPGFDFLRIALAIGVVLWHTVGQAGSSISLADVPFVWFTEYSLLNVFFALSGFLIAGSALRLKLSDFIINRSLRIVPALAVEIVLSALIIGPVFTSLPLKAYFSRWDTYHYFTNIFGVINYRLPGVFETLPNRYVNGSLWTVPFEIGCYGIMAVMISKGLLRRPRSVLALGGGILAVGLAMHLSGYRGPPHGHLQAAFDHIFYNRGSRLLVSFLAGIAAYLYRHRLPYSWRLFWFTVVWCVIVAGVWTRHAAFPPIDLITIAPLTYVTVFLGTTKLPSLPFFHTGDYSYGVYLYGWPVMQAVRASLPALASNPPVLFLLSIFPIVGCAAFSWHVIEKPILRLRKNFSFVARQRLAVPAPAPAGSHRDAPVIGKGGGRKRQNPATRSSVEVPHTERENDRNNVPLL